MTCPQFKAQSVRDIRENISEAGAVRLYNNRGNHLGKRQLAKVAKALRALGLLVSPMRYLP